MSSTHATVLLGRLPALPLGEVTITEALKLLPAGLTGLHVCTGRSRKENVNYLKSFSVRVSVFIREFSTCLAQVSSVTRQTQTPRRFTVDTSASVQTRILQAGVCTQVKTQHLRDSYNNNISEEN